jgi:hypothetical protein
MQPIEPYGMLTNVTRHPVGRRVFVDPTRGLIRAALPSMLASAPEVRRVGVASALRNCCLDDPSRDALLACPGRAGNGGGGPDLQEIAVVGFGKTGALGATEGGLEVVRALLRPISGTKLVVERCDAVRQCCAEAVAALAGGEGGCSALAACDAPALLQVGYGEEDHPETMEAMVGFHQLMTASVVHATNRVIPGSGSTLVGRMGKSTN